MRVVREMYEASSRREWERTPQFFDADVELVVPSTRPDPGVYRGRAELFRWMMGWYEGLFDSFRVEVTGMSQFGDAVVVEHRLSGRGKLSDAEVSEDSASVNIVRGGVIVRHHAEANLEDAVRTAKNEAARPR